jgi:dimethylhistidine N-methyltransferase
MSSASAEALGSLHDYVEYGHASGNFLEDVLNGLRRTPKRLPSKYFYDERGSQLFDDICELPEYYPTRTEMALLQSISSDVAALVGEGATVIEFGSGSSTKIRVLLDALDAPLAYVPVDISREHLLVSAKDLADSYPDLRVVPVCADYTKPFDVPEIEDEKVRAGFFPGSTIGNFTRDEAVSFLRAAAADLGHNNGLLIGVDLRKDQDILRAAYNDAARVTAAFNLNLLHRINRELDGDFDVGAFVHEARWVPDPGRIEMHLVSRNAQDVTIGGEVFHFEAGESIHTEDSHKYDVAGFQGLAAEAGWNPVKCWTDPDELFSIHLLRVA